MFYVPGMTIPEIMEYLKSYVPEWSVPLNEQEEGPPIALLDLELMDFEIYKKTGSHGPWCPSSICKDSYDPHPCKYDSTKKVWLCKQCNIGGDLINVFVHKYKLSPVEAMAKIIFDYDIKFPCGRKAIKIDKNIDMEFLREYLKGDKKESEA